MLAFIQFKQLPEKGADPFSGCIQGFLPPAAFAKGLSEEERELPQAKYFHIDPIGLEPHKVHIYHD